MNGNKNVFVWLSLMSAIGQVVSASAGEVDAPKDETAAESSEAKKISFQVEADGSISFTREDGTVILVPKKYVEIIRSMKSTDAPAFDRSSPCVARTVK
ncbi:MAG: hypothetical protein ACJ763_03955 [Bdellovibrionia bacterium]